MYTYSCPCSSGTLRGTDTLTIYIITVFFSMVQQSLFGQGLLLVEASRSHSDTPHSIGFLWMSDQPDELTSTCTHSTHKRLISIPTVGFEPAIPASKRPQAHALDRAATAIVYTLAYFLILLLIFYSDPATLPLKSFLFFH